MENLLALPFRGISVACYGSFRPALGCVEIEWHPSRIRQVISHVLKGQLYGLPKESLNKPPLPWRERVGAMGKWSLASYHPHPNLPPSRGQGLIQRFPKACQRSARSLLEVGALREAPLPPTDISISHRFSFSWVTGDDSWSPHFASVDV